MSPTASIPALSPAAASAAAALAFAAGEYGKNTSTGRARVGSS
ncbi:hypothetical protein RGU41_16420 [Cryobacterium sp. 10C3]|nr:hypothetical protein [Cryobacterium sp. 10C3]MDY7558191.1 hypothetical protein [Cryobacterium sp. 10C3]